ncbi:YhbY family RNA-binding protein, partial [bacterium]|nr:YhbY family RNA-binding protein [bacterium]
MTESKLKGKQARYLRGLGHSMKPLLQVGKSGITESFIKQL